MGLSKVFDISRRSLTTYQNAMNVSSHNIANASNKNYSRQRAIIQTETPEVTSNFVWGSGIRLDDVQRVRDDLIDKQILFNQQSYTSNQKQSLLLGQIEMVFSEPSDIGISNLMNQFFNSWNELAVTPNSIPLRNNVVYSAQNLAAKIGSINNDLDIIKSDMFQEFKEKTNAVNEYLTQIRELNTKIYESTAVNRTPNDLSDTRDMLVEELSKLVNLNVTYDTSGNANISIGGVFAVDGSSVTKFEAVVDDGKLKLGIANTDTTVSLKGGELAGISDTYSNKIPNYQTRLDNLFTQIVASVNTIHSSGYSLEEPPQTGINFFDGYINGKLVLNEAIVNDPNKIAVSADGTKGNAELALQLGELNSQKVIEGTTLAAYYNSLISTVGNDKLASDRMTEANSMVLEQLDLQRSSVSGVSIDEEMTDIIKFQRAYGASAKLIKIADEMLETIMNLI
ncbi:MAG: flagellar hook-associated protein FlgK [Melioribacteraceae bacterium]|nr:flagellar hook-associated protein FlgK [Melioribacteraceae bacterium]